ncbi:MAG: glycoside hydrolase family 88 protein [Prevotella sp.]|nr:glycoside hydrolase family 88 protein [Prevotella sp.]
MKRLLTILMTVIVGTATQAMPTDGRYYKIGIGTRSLFVENAGLTAVDKVLLWSDTEVAAQRWKAIDLGDGNFQFMNAYSGLYLAITNENVIQRPAATARNYGTWTLQPVEGKENTYKFILRDKILTATSMATGTQATMGDPAETTTNIEWTLTEDDDVYTEFSEDVRDDIMHCFIKKYYKKAGTGYVLGNGGWWGDAEMFETILDAFETTGDRTYQSYFQQLYTNFCSRNGTDWSGNDFNDDITWMVLACIRAYKYFGTTDYLSKAKNNFDKMYRRALQTYGTLIWCQTQDNKLSTNSCINCPATIAACYLAEMTGDQTYYDKAISLYAAQRKLLFEASTGKVNDSGEWTANGGTKVNNGWASTYNQGTMLGAALMLYNLTKDESYKQDAERIHNWTYKNLCNNKHLVSVCQTIAGDLCGFKGIYMRYARRYAQELNHEDAFKWMELNAWHAYQNRSYEGIIWSAWLTKTADNLRRMEGDETKICEPFSASTAVSVAFNAHFNRRFSKDAYEETAVRYFDDIQQMQLEANNEEGDLVTTESTAKSYLGFRNVNFGRTLNADRIIVRAKGNSSRSRILVYADSIADSQLIGRSAEYIPTEWSDVTINIEQTITGSHPIFFTFEGTGVQLRCFRFEDTTNGILMPQETTTDTHQPSPVYDLQGRPVGTTREAPLRKGLYISGGRKWVVK